MSAILIVDDEDSFLHVIHTIYQRAGYETLCANNGADALKLAHAHLPGLIILDDMMPGISGGDVCKQLKQDPAVSHIPVIMHSAGVRIKDPVYINEIGADGILLKPSMPKDMVALAERYLRQANV